MTGAAAGAPAGGKADRLLALGPETGRDRGGQSVFNIHRPVGDSGHVLPDAKGFSSQSKECSGSRGGRRVIFMDRFDFEGNE